MAVAGRRLYSYLYIVVDVFRDDVRLEPGDLLLWDNHGRYYTITTFDLKTREIRPLANIFLVKRLTRDEKACMQATPVPCKCISDLEEMLRQRILDAAKVFRHLDGKRIDELYKRSLEAAGCDDGKDEGGGEHG